MPSRVTFPESFLARVRGLARAMDNAGEIMPTLERIMWEDNRDGLLAGTDGDGRPMEKLSAHTVRYRRSITGKPDPKAPPLIPAWRESRAIKGYRVTSHQQADGDWILIGAWKNVLSKKGIPFLGFHATGTRTLPRRDIFAVRPEGRRHVSQALMAWIREKWANP